MRESPGRGRGVFASRILRRGELLEISPILVFDALEWNAHGQHTLLAHYTFNWQHGRKAFALGYGSLYNHSRKPNVGWTRDYVRSVIVFTALSDVCQGEELFIYYGRSLWFCTSESLSTSSGSTSDVESPLRCIEIEALQDAVGVEATTAEDACSHASGPPRSREVHDDVVGRCVD